METQGIRVTDGEWPTNPGEYSKHITDKGIVWFCVVPTSSIGAGSLANHAIQEHEDGTISVTPSILIDNGHKKWHGYLTKGIWKEC
jgi:hypothetical protein